MQAIRVTTPSRLHLSLIDLNGSRHRIDGSIGLAIQKPSFELLVQPSERVEIDSLNYTDRSKSVVQKLMDHYSIPGLKVKIIQEIPQHSGFGSGTQLALSISAGANRIYRLGQSVPDLAKAVGRGGTSGIGVVAFEKGGFILDGGHKYPQQKNSLLPLAAVDGVVSPPLLFVCSPIQCGGGAQGEGGTFSSIHYPFFPVQYIPLPPFFHSLYIHFSVQTFLYIF